MGTWVARYRHPTLQNAGKRPTRSKSFKDGTTSEHLAFQVALDWLWSRHETVMGSESTRPSWVTQVLEKCAQCCSPTPGACTVLAKVQQDWAAKHSSDNPAADGSASSGWSTGEGSSEDISSDDDQMGGPVKSETAAVEKGVVVKSGLPSLVLVGDCNALGHRETRDYNNSLRKSLSATFQVQVAAKPGTSWKVLAKDVDARLAELLREVTKRKKII